MLEKIQLSASKDQRENTTVYQSLLDAMCRVNESLKALLHPSLLKVLSSGGAADIDAIANGFVSLICVGFNLLEILRSKV